MNNETIKVSQIRESLLLIMARNMTPHFNAVEMDTFLTETESIIANNMKVRAGKENV